MSDPSKERFVQHKIAVTRFQNGTLLDAAQGAEGTWLIFQSDTGIQDIAPLTAPQEIMRYSIGSAPMIMTEPVTDDQTISLTVAGESQTITPRPSQLDLFQDLDVIFGEVNGQSVDTVLDWLRFHVHHHGLQGALLLFRGRVQKLINQICRRAKKIGGLKQLVCLTFDTPLGVPTLPPATHPFNCFAAPGKERMEIPPANPETSPLGAMQIFDYVRRVYLDKAAAVACLDPSDFVFPQGGETLFETAKNREGDYLVLRGLPCYPWRARNQDNPVFADHICRQFDNTKIVIRWCVIPSRINPAAPWRVRGVRKANPGTGMGRAFYRAMGIRHPGYEAGKVVPKSSLVVDQTLLDAAETLLDYKPIRPPEVDRPQKIREGSVTIVTTMKNEGPFLLEWLAYHRVIGVTDFLIYTNDCTDGTDTFFDLLQKKGLVQHRQNPFREQNLKPQHAALFAASEEEIVKTSDWLTCIDVDEFMTIKTGDGTLPSLFNKLEGVNMISMTWRLFGNSHRADFKDELTSEAYTHCAPEYCPRPHQAWGFKTLYRNQGIFKKMGVHRPKGLNAQLYTQINWVNGSGKPMPQDEYRTAWRHSTKTYGYDLISLNHYAVRNAESFLVKRDRGRVNHVERDQGLAYWFRMNNNADRDMAIHRMLPALKAEMARLLSDPEIAAAHAYSVKKHREKIDELRQVPKNEAFYEELNSKRMQRLSTLHRHFGMNVFLGGPSTIPDEVAFGDHAPDFFFTVERTETQH